MNPCNESFTEINFQPPNQRPLWKGREKKLLFKLQKKIKPINHIWADTQYLYHDNKDNLNAEFHYDIMDEGCFDTTRKNETSSIFSVHNLSCHGLTILQTILVISDYFIQILVHFQTSHMISCNISTRFNHREKHLCYRKLNYPWAD